MSLGVHAGCYLTSFPQQHTIRLPSLLAQTHLLQRSYLSSSRICIVYCLIRTDFLVDQWRGRGKRTGRGRRVGARGDRGDDITDRAGDGVPDHARGGLNRWQLVRSLGVLRDAFTVQLECIMGGGLGWTHRYSCTRTDVIYRRTDPSDTRCSNFFTPGFLLHHPNTCFLQIKSSANDYLMCVPQSSAFKGWIDGWMVPPPTRRSPPRPVQRSCSPCPHHSPTRQRHRPASGGAAAE